MKSKPTPSQIKRTFEPIRNQRDIKRIRLFLQNKPRDLLLFDLAVQTGMGMTKLLQLKVKHLAGVPLGGEIAAISGTTGESRHVLTAVAYETFHRYLEKFKPTADDYLFKSKKGDHPLNLSSVSSMIKGWFTDAKIQGNFGAISLRKTWEYHYGNKIQRGGAPTESNLKAIFDPIRTSSVQKIIYNKLISAILSGKIPPGTRLTTTEISKSFNVSHAPVRVALNWLEARGFIIAQKKKGSIVKELSITELHEIIKVRIILETAAMKLSYKVRTEKTLDTLASLTKRYKNANTFEETDQANREFHRTLYRDADMPLLVRLITDLYDRFSPYAALSYARIGSIPEHSGDKVPVDFYHVKILEGLREKNLKEIMKYLKLKIDRARLITEEVLKERKGRRLE